MSIYRKYGVAELPDGWRAVRLGGVVEVLDSERIPLSAQVRAEMAGEYPYYGANGVLDHIDRWIFDEKKALILIAEDGGHFDDFRNKPIAYRVRGKCWVNNHAHVLKAKGCVDEGYVFRSLENKDVRPFINGTTRAKLTQGDLVRMEIALPPLHEQRAISDVLDSIDAAIERTEAVIAATETLRDSLLHELLTRGVPGWHTEWKDVPGIGTIPADWEVVRLGDGVVHVGSGVTPRGGKSVYTPSGITFLRSQNVHFDGLRLENVVRIPPETDKAMARSRVQPNDVLLNITGASIGRCTVVPSDFGPANVNQHVCIIRTSDQFNPRYVWKWLSTPRSQKEIDDIQTGQSRQGLNYQQVRQLSIALPPRSEQDAFVEILSGLDATIAEAKREQDGLRSLKESTADALLTGEARINN